MHNRAVLLDDGWTIVEPKRGAKSRYAKPNSSNSHHEDDLASAALRIQRPAEQHEVSRLRDKVEQYLSQWRCHPGRAGFVSVLKAQEKRTGNEFNPLTSALCIGLGTFDADAAGGATAATTCLRQLAFYLDVVHLLGRPRPCPPQASPREGRRPAIAMAARDPKFTPTDAAVLSAFDVAVEEPSGTAAPTPPRALLFAPFAPWPALLSSVLAAPALPALYIGTPLGDAAAAIERCRVNPQRSVETGNVRETEVEGRVVGAEELVGMWRVFGRVKAEMERVCLFGAEVGWLRGCEVWVRQEGEGYPVERQVSNGWNGDVPTEHSVRRTPSSG